MTGLVLASGSSSRAAMLRAAGVAFVQDIPEVDETAIKDQGRAEGWNAAMVAEALAHAKAYAVSGRHPGAVVLGGDQMLECEGTWFDKPEDRDGARRQLLALRGKTHRLISAAVLLRDGNELRGWTQTAELSVRPFSDVFLERYLDDVGEDIFSSVGAYRIEELGIHLFERVNGDVFTVRGLPMFDLMEGLRDLGLAVR